MKTNFFLAGLLLACASVASAQVAVTDPWIRGTVPGQKATGAFMQLASGADTSLVAVASPIASVVEIHEMSMDGGVMKMRAIPALPVAAGKPVALAPGGYHVMLMDLAQPLKEGEKVTLTLTFADKAGRKTTQDVTATVRGLASGPTKH